MQNRRSISKWASSLLPLVCLSWVTGGAVGQTDGIACITRDMLATVDFNNPFNDAVFTENLAILGGISSPVHIFDMTDPRDPVLIAVYPMGGTIQALEVRQSMMLVSGGLVELEIVDISTPATPERLGTIDIPDEHAHDLAIAGDFAYVIGHGGDLYVIDISDVSNPVVVGEYITPFGTDDYERVHVQGPFAYILNTRPSSNLLVFDITNPTNPHLVGEVNVVGLGLDLALVGSYAYVASSEGLFTFDISNPTVPAEVDRLDIDITSVATFENRLFALVKAFGVWAFDLSDPSSPGFGMAYPPRISGGVLRISAETGRASAGYTDQVFMDFTVPHEDSVRGVYSVPETVQDFVVSNEVAYISTSSEGLLVLDVSDPDQLDSLGTFSPSGVSGRMDIEDDFVYLIDSDDGVRVLDVSNPASIVSRGSYDNANNIGDVAAQDDVLFIANTGRGLTVVDVSDPDDPVEIARLVGRFIDLIEIGPGAVFARDGNKLAIYDVTNPADPVLASLYQSSGQEIAALAADGNRVWIAEGYDSPRVVLLNASNLSDPVVVGSFDVDQRVKSITYANGVLSLTTSLSPGTVRMYDVSNPTDVRLLGQRLGGEPGFAQLDGSVLWSMELESSRLVALDVSDCPPCPPDFDNNGIVDTRDFIEFLNAWSAGDSSADFDNNGIIDTRDFIEFLNLWNAGC